MKNIGLAAAGLVLGLFIGFNLGSKDNFQLVEQEDGSVVRLNTGTGEMFVLRGDTVIKVVMDTTRTTDDDTAEPEKKKKKLKWKAKKRSRFDAAFAKDRSISEWEKIRFDKGGSKVNAYAILRSRLKDGNIQYVFRMRIVSKACWRKDSHDMVIKLQDSAGNALKTINVHAVDRHIVRQPDKRTIDICVDGTVPCDEATYGQFARWYLQWTWYDRAIKK